MTKSVYLLTDERGFFGQLLMPWESMDIAKIIAHLSISFRVNHVTYEAVANGEVHITDGIVLHSSSQKPEYKRYIQDVLIALESTNNRIVPSMNMFHAHENKGFQEIYRRLIDLPSIGAIYLCGTDTLGRQKIHFPAVFKEINGYGSGGVEQADSLNNLARLATAYFSYTVAGYLRKLKSDIAYVVRRFILRQKNLRPYGDYLKPQKRFVVQNFIPGLSFDYKVIVLGRKLYVLKRLVRENDFRASGSGRFLFEEPVEGLLDFAAQIHKIMSEPYLSLDICFDGNQFHLIEFQGVHFGPYTIMKSEFYHVRDASGRWTKIYETPDLEQSMAEALRDYVARIAS